uniref:Uncharacterized protein n=2 Tax=Aegilops tauschii subsp. strangulata TaxID=200361 RepID=A0A453G920_AEGTS
QVISREQPIHRHAPSHLLDRRLPFPEIPPPADSICFIDGAAPVLPLRRRQMALAATQIDHLRALVARRARHLARVRTYQLTCLPPPRCPAPRQRRGRRLLPGAPPLLQRGVLL